jgi:IclR family transcriptional regulator, KDG regulon repressor
MNRTKDTERLPYSAPIVSKALQVLKVICSAPRNPGISEIAATLDFAKSTTHGILAALEATGWVLRDPVTRKYTCGYAAKNLAEKATVRIALVEQARPYLEQLEKDLDEDIFLGMSAGDQLLILDQVESSKELKVRARPGTRISQFAGAAGKIFMAHHGMFTVKRILQAEPMPAFTPHSITDPDRYIEELKLVRREGVARDMEEYLPNVWAVAIPIFHGKKARRRMVAAFWAVGVNSESSPQRIRHAERLGRITGEILSRTITNIDDSIIAK